MALGTAFWGSKALLSAVELNVFGTLADGPLPLEQLRDKVGLHPRSARDFLDALVALGLLERDQDGYRNGADTEAFLDPAKPGYVGGLLEMFNTRLYGFWGSLTEALRTGAPQNETKTHGGDPFTSIYADPDRLAVFLASMSGFSADAGAAIAGSFPWEQHRSFCDLGAAQGMVPVQLARRHPHLTGTGFDLPAVQPVFEKFVASHGLQQRIAFQGGDFFTDPLPPADVYVLGHILHDWDLEAKLALLRRVHDALPAGGAVIVYEALIDDDRRSNAAGLLMSLNMLIETPGGFDYTGADCQGWLAQTGFARSRVQPLAGPDSMVVGIK